MTINSTQTKILEILWENQQVNSNKILTENDKKTRNVSLRKQAQVLSTILPRIRVDSTEFENIEESIVNNEVEYLYKEWELNLLDAVFVEPDVLIDFIIPYLNYEIVYKEPQRNDIDFYNAELDLQQTSFWEIKNQALILHISTYMKRYFESNQLITPQAKIILTYKNPLQILN